MTPEFHQLAEKVARLAELAQALRRENADLRRTIATLHSENADLMMRIGEAQQRVSALLDKIPVLEEK